MSTDENEITKLVTIANFNEPVNAHMLCNMLEAQGVAAFIADENMAGAYGSIGSFISGAKVQVRESDQQQALELMQEFEQTRELAREQADKLDLKCPKCKCDNVVEVNTGYNYIPIAQIVLIVITLGMFWFLGFVDKRKCYQCRNCMYQWWQKQPLSFAK
ncbi:MAG: DUF2007 domain-containing protein [Phycisphaerae bacterium]|nr:DUF2007 domain-containing protein [Phycisphaerae bacterium]